MVVGVILGGANSTAVLPLVLPSQADVSVGVGAWASMTAYCTLWRRFQGALNACSPWLHGLQT
jgi:hypothetical protein